MAQNYFQIDGVTVYQPDANPQWDWETMYTSDTTRLQGTGELVDSPMWTTQSWEYKASYVPVADAKTILQKIIPTPTKKHYTIHVWNPYQGAWVDVECYTGKGTLHIGELSAGEEYYDEISFQMIGVRKLV